MTPPKQPSKDHHYVPQFYIRQWADTRGRVTSVSAEDQPGVIRRPNPRGILHELHLNTAFAKSGDHLYGEEWILKKIDDEASRILPILAAGTLDQITPAIITQLHPFLLTLQARHPRVHRQLMEEEAEIIASAREDVLKREPGMLEAVNKNWRYFLDDFQTPRDRATFLRLLFATFRTSLSTAIFQDKPFRVFDVGGFGHVFTSDYPFFSVPTVTGAVRSIADPDALHVFPICPTRVLVLTRNMRALQEIQLRPKRVRLSLLNLLIVTYAQEYVYGVSESEAETVRDLVGKAASNPDKCRRSYKNIADNHHPMLGA